MKIGNLVVFIVMLVSSQPAVSFADEVDEILDYVVTAYQNDGTSADTEPAPVAQDSEENAEMNS